MHNVIVGSGELTQNTEMLITKQVTKKKKNEKTLAFFHCTCLTVASIDIHYKYIYICTYIYIHIYYVYIYIILPFYVHIYYSQILNTQHMGARKGRQRRWTGIRKGCVHNFVLLQEHRKTVLEILGK